MSSFKRGKLHNKTRLSASIDRDALRLLHRMASADHRSPSNALNMLIYEAADRRGLRIGVSAPQPEQGQGKEPS